MRRGLLHELHGFACTQQAAGGPPRRPESPPLKARANMESATEMSSARLTAGSYCHIEKEFIWNKANAGRRMCLIQMEQSDFSFYSLSDNFVSVF